MTGHAIGRRELIVVLGGLTSLLVLRAHGQGRRAKVAIPLVTEEYAYLADTLKEGMREQGFADGSVDYDVRFIRTDPIPKILAEMLSLQPDAIVVVSPPMVRAAMELTRSVPIVMSNVSNPVGNGFVESLARPGGNVTGVATLYETGLPKVVEALVQIVPAAQRVTVLVNETNPSTTVFWEAAEGALRALGKTPLRLNASSEGQVVDAFARMRGSGTQGVVVVPDLTFATLRNRIASLATQASLPTAYGLREHVVAGGLVSYGPSLAGNYRAAARYVAKILRGTKPADLAVEQPSRFELVVNRSAAKALGVSIPSVVMLRADELID